MKRTCPRPKQSCASCKGQAAGPELGVEPRLDGPGEMGSPHTEALLRPLFWPRVLVWLASWSVTPAPRQVPQALRMLAPQGWLPGNHSCLSSCPWVRGVRSVSPTWGTLRAECAHPRDSRNWAAFLREPKVTPRHQPHPSGSTPAEKPTLAPCIIVTHWTRLTPTSVFKQQTALRP